MGSGTGLMAWYQFGSKPSLYHHEIFRSNYQWQKWYPCKRSKVKVTDTGSGNGMLPVWYQAITWTNVDLSYSGPYWYVQCGSTVDTGSGNGMLPVWYQAITWTNVDLSYSGPYWYVQCGSTVDTGSGNGMLPVWYQAITWTNVDLSYSGP